RAGDASDIGEKIAALVRDEELIVAMAARGVARARAEFTPETHLQQLENAYRNILARS
ncbi:MAG: glycosyltransferase family 1 protein, partial [Actinobacteria bacterium]|nr:glycosyltransferase family 1 protein [Actinomycetota bacterium]